MGCAARAVRRATHILFDFDGPVCSLFADPAVRGGSLAPHVAEELKAVLRTYGGLPAGFAGCDDPHALYAAAEPGEASAAARKRLDEWELRCAETAEPTAGAGALITALRAAGKRLAVASNNSEPAIRRYLERTGLARAFEGPVAGRGDDPALLKPDPDCLHRVMADQAAAPADCLMIGDSPADTEAARAAGVAFCGYATTRERRGRLSIAGADPRLLVADLGALARAITRQ